MHQAQLPWGADRAAQQWGRVHRSNQVVPPRYEIPVLDVPGENRFLSAIVKRLKMLAALTQGNKKANLQGGMADLNRYDLHDAFAN